MKKRHFLLLPVLAIISAAFFSCSKDNTTRQKTKTELIVSGSWRLTAAVMNGADAMPLIEDCKKDNLISFMANGNGSIADGASKCNTSDPDSTPFTWTFENNETLLRLSTILITNGSSDLTIDKLTETELILTGAYTPPVGPTRSITLTFKH